MDYTKERVTSKIRKGLRYLRLYGPGRTLIKIKGQYHLQRVYEKLPSQRNHSLRNAHVGIIGCGNYAFTVIAYFLTKNFGKVIKGAMDIDINRAASLFQTYGLEYYTADSNTVLDDDSINLVFVASNHASHAQYAIRALSRGKSVHIEKPHVVTLEQLRELCLAMQASRACVSIGFNRPWSKMGRAIHEYLKAGKGPAMMNWFIVGHQLPADHWYCKKEEGGRVFGNMCHWTDFVYNMIPPEERYPITIQPIFSDDANGSDVAIALRFGGGTIATICFCSKGYSFEGVRERFSAQKGDVIIGMEDFRRLVVDIRERRVSCSQIFQDHGHEARIKSSYAMVQGENSKEHAASIPYVWETGELFIRTKQALDENKTQIVQPFTAGLLSDQKSQFSSG